jgi:hypothetical protein
MASINNENNDLKITINFLDQYHDFIEDGKLTGDVQLDTDILFQQNMLLFDVNDNLKSNITDWLNGINQIWKKLPNESQAKTFIKNCHQQLYEELKSQNKYFYKNPRVTDKPFKNDQGEGNGNPEIILTPQISSEFILPFGEIQDKEDARAVSLSDNKAWKAALNCNKIDFDGSNIYGESSWLVFYKEIFSNIVEKIQDGNDLLDDDKKTLENSIIKSHPNPLNTANCISIDAVQKGSQSLNAFFNTLRQTYNQRNYTQWKYNEIFTTSNEFDEASAKIYPDLQYDSGIRNPIPNKILDESIFKEEILCKMNKLLVTQTIKNDNIHEEIKYMQDLIIFIREIYKKLLNHNFNTVKEKYIIGGTYAVWKQVKNTRLNKISTFDAGTLTVIDYKNKAFMNEDEWLSKKDHAYYNDFTVWYLKFKDTENGIKIINHYFNDINKVLVYQYHIGVGNSKLQPLQIVWLIFKYTKLNTGIEEYISFVESFKYSQYLSNTNDVDKFLYNAFGLGENDRYRNIDYNSILEFINNIKQEIGKFQGKMEIDGPNVEEDKNIKQYWKSEYDTWNRFLTMEASKQGININDFKAQGKYERDPPIIQTIKRVVNGFNNYKDFQDRNKIQNRLFEKVKIDLKNELKKSKTRDSANGTTFLKSKFIISKKGKYNKENDINCADLIEKKPYILSTLLDEDETNNNLLPRKMSNIPQGTFRNNLNTKVNENLKKLDPTNIVKTKIMAELNENRALFFVNYNFPLKDNFNKNWNECFKDLQLNDINDIYDWIVYIFMHDFKNKNSLSKDGVYSRFSVPINYNTI